MDPLIKLQVMNTVLFETTTVSVYVTKDEMHHSTATHNINI